jgi:hypothetical protein
MDLEFFSLLSTHCPYFITVQKDLPVSHCKAVLQQLFFEFDSAKEFLPYEGQDGSYLDDEQQTAMASFTIQA